MSQEDWKPSQAYLDYCASMKKHGTIRLAPESSEAVIRRLDAPANPTPALVRLMREPFAPCPRYQPIPHGCAVCAHSIEDEPCPDLKEVFTEAFTAVEGGDPTSGHTNDGSGESEPGGATDVQD